MWVRWSPSLGFCVEGIQGGVARFHITNAKFIAEWKGLRNPNRGGIVDMKGG
jgi:hypothetical protein